MPVGVCRAVTVAPTMGLPSLSVTRPLKAALVIPWAVSSPGRMKQHSMTVNNILFMK